MNVRLLLFPLVLVPALAFAQNDEWSNFPPNSPPPATGTPTQGSTQTPAQAPAQAPTSSSKKGNAATQQTGAPIESLEPAPKSQRQNTAGTAAPANEAQPSGSLPVEPLIQGPGENTPAATPTESAPPPTHDTAGAQANVSPTTDASAGNEPVVVSQGERFLPGTEPHSPSTLNNSWTAMENRRVSPNTFGSAGLLHTSAAYIGPKGLVKFGVMGEYLNQRNFPVLEAIDVRTAGTFSASYVPVEWLEAFVAYGASSNTNSFSSPTLIQALGDVTLGVKAAKEWRKGIAAGVEVRGMSFSGVGNQDVSRYAWGIAPRAVASFDIRQFAEKVPLLVHLNAGASFDSTGSLVKEHALNASEEFALGTQRYNRFIAGAALEAPLRAVTPFLEWNLGVPLGVKGGKLVSPDGSSVSIAQAMPQTLGGGLKITAIKDLTLLAAIDFGLTQTVGLGVPATAPWNLSFGAAFNIDPFQRGETKVVETLRERKIEAPLATAPKVAKIEGVVIDSQTKKPIPGVIVAMVGAGVPPVASDEEGGKFLSQELKPGAVTLKATKDGYTESSQAVTLQAGETTQVQLALEPKAKLAHFVLTANSTDKKKAPVVAQVKFKGPTEQTVPTNADGSPAKWDAPAGQYNVTVQADGFLAQTREVSVTADGELKLAFDLEPQPKKKLVIVKNDKIEILQQVHFVTGKATILADSNSLLNQVVDAIVSNDIKKIRIEGHTDNKGGKKKNQQLSEDRAAAVGDYLIKAGIDPSRIETKGYGDSKPIAPNMTARGRELNRRVEFVIVER